MRRDIILAGALLALVAFYYRKPIAETTGTVVTAIKKLTRGVRNNNPGNIVRTSTKWQGMKADQSADSRFIVFTEPEYGIRAIARILQNYSNAGINTVRGIINRWAPPTENDTGAYVAAVARALKVTADTPLNVSSNLLGLVTAIIKHENGYIPYSESTISDGIRRALN